MEQVQREALPADEVSETLHDKWAAVLGRAGANLLRRQPHRLHNAAVEGAADFVHSEIAGKCEAQKGDRLTGVRRWRAPHVHTEQGLRSKAVGSFLEGFARTGFDQRLARIKMAGWLIEPYALVGFFLDQQEAAVMFDDSGNRDIGFPGGGTLEFGVQRARSGTEGQAGAQSGCENCGLSRKVSILSGRKRRASSKLNLA